MSLARRWQNAQKFTAEGYPDFTLNDEHRRLMHDEVVERSWLQCRVQYEQADGDKHCSKVAMTDQELLDYEILHYWLVHAHPEIASAWITQLGIDASPYIPADDPFERTRVRPLIVDKEELWNHSVIETRRRLREAVEGGHMLKVRRIVDQDLGPDFFSTNPELLLRLLLQHVVELVRDGKYAAAVEFMQAQVAPFAEANPGYLVDIEHTTLVFSVDLESPQGSEGSTEGREALWLLSLKRRYELFRSINDRILRLVGIEPRDVIQESEYLHAHLDRGVRKLVHAAEALVAQDPGNQTRIAILESYKSWRLSLLSLQDVTLQREQQWRGLMARAEAEGVDPDPEMQHSIEQAFQELVRETDEASLEAVETPHAEATPAHQRSDPGPLH